jgi:peptidyl-tRNA hydrolase
VAKYVLSNFEREEVETLESEVFGKIYDRIVQGQLTPDA